VNKKIIKIGTRGSKLALTQSSLIKKIIENKHSDIGVELVIIKTKGDKIIDSPLSKIGGKGLFVKEIEDSLLDEKIDIAVHSIKDVPAELPEGLCIPFFPEREDPGDAFLSLKYKSIQDLPEGARVGTGSLRRSSQLLNMRQDIVIVPIRGNVDTRMGKLEKQELDAIILATSGLNRMGLSSEIKEKLSPEILIPAVGQGALGLEIRENDKLCHDILGFINHGETELAVKAERAFLKRLEGGCQVPIGAFAKIKNNQILIRGMVAELDGSRIIKAEHESQCDDPDKTGITLAEKLLDAGADKILASVYNNSA
jgi:hydroxymethylbilane synthase